MKIPTFFHRYFDLLNFGSNIRHFIVAEMTAPHRHYHTLGHLARMLNDINNDPTSVSDVFERELVAAVFFHDIVYDVHQDDNEEQSVVTAKLWLDAVKHDLDMPIVEELIIATKEHDFHDLSSYAGSNLRKVFLSADLSILWSKSSIYEWYAKGIRKEYAHVPNEAYRKGRAQVIKKFIYDVPEYRRAVTRANIEWETARLAEGFFDVP